MIETADHNEAGRLKGELYALTEIAKALTSARALPDLLAAVMDRLIAVLDIADMSVILLWDQSAGLFRPAAAYGCDFEALRAMGLRDGESITGKVYDEGVARLLGGPAEVDAAMADMRPANQAVFERALGPGVRPTSTLAAPLQVGDHKFGALLIHTLRDTAHFTERDLPLAETLAELIALAIDRARLEEEAEATRDAQKADRLRSEVMAALSHELRTPLTAIKGYSTALLLDEVKWPEDKQREFLGLIDQECDNLQAMIGDILDSSLFDIGQLSIAREPVRMLYLAQEVVEEMQRRTDLHQFVIDFPPDFPLIDADPRRITQVLRNILDNAIKYSPQGGLVLVRGEVRPDDVVISIADQGVGISPEDLIPLFEKYFRVKAPTGYHVAGTGLGLPNARAIVEAHGGRIWAESALGEGTTLYFSLPRLGLSAQPD